LMDRWLINGLQAESLPVEDRGLHYGDGLFETMACRDGRIRLLDKHLQRLRLGCQRLQLPTDFISALTEDIDNIVAGESYGTLKLIVTRGSGQRGYAPPASPQLTVIMGFSAAVAEPVSYARVRFCRTPIGRNESLAGIKTLNRLEQVLARAEWDGSDPFDEGLMINDRGEVVCGTMSNLFVIKDQLLLTPRLNECGVLGVMRSHIMELAACLNIEVREDAFNQADVLAADTVFLTNALKGIWPVETIEGMTLGTSDLLTRLQAELNESFGMGRAS
ncbi:MAG: aminodeoxychorismate lyase, partial [Gammaproteobacteria bacterium]